MDCRPDRRHIAGEARTTVTDNDQRRYFRDRAEAEIAAASATGNPAACRAHYELAELYLDRAYADGEPGGDEAEPQRDPA